MATRRSFLLTLSALGGGLVSQGSAYAAEIRRLVYGVGPASSGFQSTLKDPDGSQAESEFSPSQMVTLAALAAAIIPEDTTPSARDLGAGAYVATGLGLLPEEEVRLVKSGLDNIALLAEQQFGRSLDRLDPSSLQKLAGVISSSQELVPLWLAVRALTVLHYYAQEEGFSDLGLPGPSIDRGGFPDPINMSCLI
ncbi:MAG: gluconate 2-dehydrogenase subunit 3 family protein [Lautropia sp.]|nr:gluconate 2-dehydrogenase subunit 3 family protein [Lautropia sp.]